MVKSRPPFLCLVAAASLMLSSFSPAADMPSGFWPLVDDSIDYTGQWGDAVNHGATFSPCACDGVPVRFNGQDAYFEAPGRVPFGADDFTLLLWVGTKATLDDGLGDLLRILIPTGARGSPWAWPHTGAFLTPSRITVPSISAWTTARNRYGSGAAARETPCLCSALPSMTGRCTRPPVSRAQRKPAMCTAMRAAAYGPTAAARTGATR